MLRRVGPLLLLAALAGCGGGEERAEPASATADPAEFVAAVDERCDRTRTATREGPRFPSARGRMVEATAVVGRRLRRARRDGLGHRRVPVRALLERNPKTLR